MSKYVKVMDRMKSEYMVIKKLNYDEILIIKRDASYLNLGYIHSLTKQNGEYIIKEVEVECPYCNGSGCLEDETECDTCYGNAYYDGTRDEEDHKIYYLNYVQNGNWVTDIIYSDEYPCDKYHADYEEIICEELEQILKGFRKGDLNQYKKRCGESKFFDYWENGYAYYFGGYCATRFVSNVRKIEKDDYLNNK